MVFILNLVIDQPCHVINMRKPYGKYREYCECLMARTLAHREQKTMPQFHGIIIYHTFVCLQK